MNDPRDLETLHAIVCRRYGDFREQGGRADSTYLPFFMDTMANASADASMTIAVLRDDGSKGVIDLAELFRDLGYLE